MSDNTTTEIINRINDSLRAQGKAAVQEIKMTNKEGKVIGQVRYGYRPQYVFDAINESLLPENWYYEVASKEIYETQAVVEVKLFVRFNGEWLCKGSQCGQMQIIKGNIGDAYKGAITDAIQKCFSLLSIGTDSFRGLLEQVYNSHRSQQQTKPRLVQPPVDMPKPPTTQSTQPKPAETQQTTTPTATDMNNLPQITGIEYQQADGCFIASGAGVYEKKSLLKAAGFKWNSTSKHWFLPIEGAAAVNA